MRLLASATGRRATDLLARRRPHRHRDLRAIRPPTPTPIPSSTPTSARSPASSARSTTPSRLASTERRGGTPAARSGWAGRFVGSGAKPGREITRALPMAVADFVGEWFESDAVRAALAARGTRFTAMGPWSAGTALVLLERLCRQRRWRGWRERARPRRPDRCHRCAGRGCDRGGGRDPHRSGRRAGRSPSTGGRGASGSKAVSRCGRRSSPAPSTPRRC